MRVSVRRGRDKQPEPYNQATPRDMIPKNTPEYAWRSIQRLKAMWSKVEIDEREVEKVLRDIEEARAFDYWPQSEPYRSLDALVEAELGKPLPEVTRQIAATATERAIKAGRNQETGRVLPADGSVNQHNLGRQIVYPQDRRASSLGIGLTTQKKLDRLARDFPDLHERVKAGELSVNAAAVQAGIVKPTLTVPCDVEGAIRSTTAKRTSTEIWPSGCGGCVKRFGRRLKRDDPDLARRVIRGDATARRIGRRPNRLLKKSER